MTEQVDLGYVNARARKAMAAASMERAAFGREVLDRLRHEITINPALTYEDAIEWVEFILARRTSSRAGTCR